MVIYTCTTLNIVTSSVIKLLINIGKPGILVTLILFDGWKWPSTFFVKLNSILAALSAAEEVY